jgi:hypothetical protein
LSMRGLVLVGLGVFWLSACSTVPFQEIELVAVAEANPEAVLDEFAVALPERFLIVNTVTFEFKGRAFAAIGYTDVDASQQTFTVVGVHPAGGLKLFEVSGDSEDAQCTFALEELTRWGDFSRVVAEDTRRMYLDRVPGPNATISKERYRILFRQQAEDGEIEYVFGGADGVLVEKRYYEEGRRLWSVSYYEYRRESGKLYPAGIILENHKRGYRLVVRLREIRS